MVLQRSSRVPLLRMNACLFVQTPGDLARVVVRGGVGDGGVGMAQRAGGGADLGR